MNASAPRRWLTPKECGELLGFSTKAIYAMASRGDLPVVRICPGRRKGIRVDGRELEKRLEAQLANGRERR